MQRAVTRFIVILAFAGLMAAGARIDIPMHPVPMTMQSFAVLLAGLCLGPVGGATAAVAYLLLALIGLPILSGGASGLAPFTGATAGYLYAFPVAAGLAGGLARSRYADHPLTGILGLFGLHIVLLGLGTAWLANQSPFMTATANGFTPFLIGAGVKSALCWIAWTAWKSVRRDGTG